MPNFCHQFFVGADVGDGAILDHHDAVGAAHRGKPVRDHEHGAAAHQIVQRGLHQRFRLAVERGSGFVQNQDWRIFQHGARDGDALALAAGKPHAALADHGVVTRGQRQ